MRFGQLVDIIMSKYGRDTCSLFYIEDNDFEDKIDQFVKDSKKHLTMAEKNSNLKK